MLPTPSKYSPSQLLQTVCASVLILVLCSGCYVNMKIPLDRDLNKTELGEKVGRSTAKTLFWGFHWGDAGTQAAAEDGGITTINHLDREVFVVLAGLYAKNTTIAYGD